LLFSSIHEASAAAERNAKKSGDAADQTGRRVDKIVEREHQDSQIQYYRRDSAPGIAAGINLDGNRIFFIVLSAVM
jgi:hypothetical protein